MKTGFKVCDVMTLKPVSVQHDLALSEAAKIMHAKHVGSLLVKKGRTIGLITEQDIVRKAVARSLHPDKTIVDDVAEYNVHTISPEKDIYDALLVMRERNIRHLPVMDKGKMLGFLTGKDILKVNPSLFDVLAEKIELREEHRKPLNAEEGVCDECGEVTHLSKQHGRSLCEQCRT